MYPESTALLLAVAMLAGATIADFATRRVRNQYWLAWLGGAIVLDVLLLVDQPEQLLSVGMSGIACVMFYMMWRFRLFGGADAKGLMVLALLLPATSISPASVPAFDILMNGLLGALLLPVILTIWNAVQGHWSPVMMLGLYKPVDWAKERHYWPLETVVDGARKKVIFGRRAEPWATIDGADIAEVWVTPKMPFMAFIFAGLLIFIPFGNVILAALIK